VALINPNVWYLCHNLLHIATWYRMRNSLCTTDVLSIALLYRAAYLPISLFSIFPNSYQNNISQMLVNLCSELSLFVLTNHYQYLGIVQNIEKTNNEKYGNVLIICRLFITNIRDLITSDDHIICTIVFFDSQLIKKSYRSLLHIKVY
jgi:hypothetical protein